MGGGLFPLIGFIMTETYTRDSDGKRFVIYPASPRDTLYRLEPIPEPEPMPELKVGYAIAFINRYGVERMGIITDVKGINHFVVTEQTNYQVCNLHIGKENIKKIISVDGILWEAKK